MAGFIRRVVTGHDANGKAIILSDGLTPSIKTNPLRPGFRSTDIWKTDCAPARITREEPDPTLGRYQIPPPSRGNVFRITELAPESEVIRNLSAEKARELFKEMGAEEASTYGRTGRHPLMHRTETLDYAVVLDGELTMLLDDSEVTLKSGDVVVQRGTNHAWVNRTDKVCRILFVLIDGQFDEETKSVIT